MGKTYYFLTPNITCPACVAPIKGAVLGLHPSKLKISYVDVDLVTKRLSVTVENNDDYSDAHITKTIMDAVNDTGQDCSDITNDAMDELTAKSIRWLWIKGIIGAIVGVILLILFASGVGLPFIALLAIAGISTLLTLALGMDTYIKAWKNLFKPKTISMDLLYAACTLLILAVSIAALFVPGLPMMFESALLILSIEKIGNAVKLKAQQNASSSLRFRDRAASPVDVIINDDEKQSCPVNDLKKGQRIRIYPGQTVPVNCICLENSEVDTSIITGSRLSTSVKPGDFLHAGLKVPAHINHIDLRVEATADNSYLAYLDNKMRETRRQSSSLETTTDKLLKYFIPTIVILAIISFIVISVLYTPALGLVCALAVLVSTCPCTLGVIGPFANKLAIAKAAERGALFKTDKSVETAAEIDTVVVDLNGTLTNGKPSVTSIQIRDTDNFTEESVLDLLYSLEADSTHVIADAIRKYAEEKKPNRVKTPLVTNSADHTGIRATIEGIEYIVGNSDMMRRHGIDISDQPARQNAEHVIFLAKAGRVISVITLKDQLRPDAIVVLNELKSQGKKIHLLTGTDKVTADAYADLLGIPAKDVHANYSANDKPCFIRRLKNQGRKVAMVGDGINDTLAIAESHCGIAMQSIDNEPRAAAQVTIERSSLLPVAALFSAASGASSNIKQNLCLSFTYNLVIILIAGGLLVSLGFVLNPWLGIALMVLQMSLILLNALRFQYQALPDLTKKIPTQQLNSTATMQNGLGVRPGVAPLLSAASHPEKRPENAPILTGKRASASMFSSLQKSVCGLLPSPQKSAESATVRRRTHSFVA